MGKKQKVEVINNPWGFVLFMAYAGAVVYFVDRNDGFWGFLLAFIQAALWPAYIVYEALSGLGV